MKTQSTTQTEKPSATGLNRDLSGISRRRCASCGQHTIAGSECTECSKKKQILQRKATHQSEVEEVPAIVHEVLNSPGQPLDANTRAFMEPRFQQDFSQVRIHTDAKAAESAEAVNALAYTVRRDVVFGAGQYTPGTIAGNRLLAHELTHVVQQNFQPYHNTGLSINTPNSVHEQEADQVAATISHPSNLRSPISIPARQLSPTLQRQLKADEFPGFSQGAYNTCGAASVVSALMIWDRERKNPMAPNDLVVTACNIILVHLNNNRTSLITNFDKINLKGKGKGKKLYDEIFDNLTAIRDAARMPAAKITEDQYQSLGLALFVLHFSGTAGLSKAEITSLLSKLGLDSGKSETAQTFDDLLNSSILQNLQPGQVSQLSWWVKTGQPDATGTPLGYHAFLIGRFQRGTWFLSDQGTTPPTELEAGSLQALKLAIQIKANSGYWIHTGGGTSQFIVGGWTGVQLLGDRSGVEKQARDNVIEPGKRLAEVDKGTFTKGELISAWDFVARAYSLDEAKQAFGGSGTGHGGVIVENPLGLFHVYKTNPVSEDNVNVPSIDESDSAGMLLANQSASTMHG